MDNHLIFVRAATADDVCYADDIITETEKSAIARGSGISKRPVEMVIEKILSGKAVIAVTLEGEWVGFSYFEVWENGLFVSHSGLIVAPQFRQSGVAKSIKSKIFRMSRARYPQAKLFSITSGTAVMRLNASLGFVPVGFDAITHDEAFWNNCKSCTNYDILCRKGCKNCLCTAMLFQPDQSLNHHETEHQPKTLCYEY